ncbi:origin recognition complex subunit 3 [Tasmannia lanceolata]|uniref:origin recognition complex subunit 3 n=1 Tax=Tasmannia lanceolata TaxID=3420 RepID=UPI0040632AAC
MSPSVTPDSPPSPSKSENSETNLQPFFVLHKALPRKSEGKASGSRKTRRKIDLSPTLLKSNDKSDSDNHLYEQLRIEAFDLVWSNIETTIKGVLRRINVDLFNEIYSWVCESFSATKSTGTLGIYDVKRSYPVVINSICKQIFTALILTKNVEFVDDLLTFEELGIHLKSHGCHVANISSLDFSVKNGVGGCLRSLLRQTVAITPDVVDISILAAWYSEPDNYDKPVVVIIDDIERCSGIVLAEFIMMLSEWVIKIPIILVIGVATTVDAPRKVLPSSALEHLEPRQFTLGSPIERMDAIVEDVLVKPTSGFNVGYKVAAFLRNYFLKHDGTVSAFIRALKIACMKHFSMEILSFLAKGTFNEDSQGFWSDKCKLLPEVMLKYAFDLPSCQRLIAEKVGDNLAHGLSEVKKLRKNWSSVVMCLYEAGKFHRMQLLDILCEALDPDFCNLEASDYLLTVGKDITLPSSADHGLHDGECSGLTKGRFILQAVQTVRDLPVALLLQLLKLWEKHTVGIDEVIQKVKELQSVLTFEDHDKTIEPEGLRMRGRPMSRHQLTMEKCTSSVNEKAALLVEFMIRNYLTPLECAPFHEIVCFKHVDILQSALIGDPRRTIQVDLLKSHTYLCCSCCNKGGSILLPSMHDTSIMYNLAQEHGDLINLHDWYQSFRATVLSSCTKTKHKLQRSPMSKKRKPANAVANVFEASIQARFCRAVTELQITGLLRMPSKRRPDFLQRVAFGL